MIPIHIISFRGMLTSDQGITDAELILPDEIFILDFYNLGFMTSPFVSLHPGGQAPDLIRALILARLSASWDGVSTWSVETCCGMYCTISPSIPISSEGRRVGSMDQSISDSLMSLVPDATGDSELWSDICPVATGRFERFLNTRSCVR